MAWVITLFRVSPSAPGQAAVISCISRSTAAGRAPSAQPAAANDRVNAAGRDSVADTALLQAGAISALFDQLRAPSTIGSCLRSSGPTCASSTP
jgi:hypothetical protein